MMDVIEILRREFSGDVAFTLNAWLKTFMRKHGIAAGSEAFEVLDQYFNRPGPGGRLSNESF